MILVILNQWVVFINTKYKKTLGKSVYQEKVGCLNCESVFVFFFLITSFYLGIYYKNCVPFFLICSGTEKYYKSPVEYLRNYKVKLHQPRKFVFVFYCESKWASLQNWNWSYD